MRVLITGGAGYIGSVLARSLLGNNCQVTVLDNFMHGQQPLGHLCWDPDFEIVRGDARDHGTMRGLLSKVDTVIPLAAIVGAPACAADPIAASTTNNDAIAMLARLLHSDQRLLIPITNSGYGIGGNEVCTEDSPLKPITHYGRTKVAAEKIAFEEHQNTVSFRLATVFGMSPRLRLDLLVNDFVHRAAFDKALVLFEAHFRRNYIHVLDVARVFAHGIKNFETMKGRAYNVGLSDANLTKLELCERIKQHVPGFYFTEAPVGEDPDKRDYIVSNARIEATGWRPTRTLDDGIGELLKGYRMLRRTEHGNA